MPPVTEPETIDLFDYDLPPEFIAQSPAEPRESSRLLVLPRDGGALHHKLFRDLPDLLEPGDLLVLNDTRVSARRLVGKKPTGAGVEVLLMRPLGDRRYEAMVRPARRLRTGARIVFEDAPNATVLEEIEAGLRVVVFDDEIANAGQMPLPPYFHGNLPDAGRYQTVYAGVDGSAAAPTAGLHFSHELLQNIEGKGVKIAKVTLHIGLDTFRPLPEGALADVRLHGENFVVTEATAETLRGVKGRVIAVGTTSVRVLESNAVGFERRTDLFIAPGYHFKAVSGIVTNFHLPKTTMLVMICAFAGRERVLAAYDAAMKAGYRFLSFGDSMAIL